MRRIIIGGDVTIVEGNNIVVIDDKIIVGSTVIKSGLSGIVEVKFEGDLVSLHTHGNASVKGDIHGNVDAHGNVQCGNVGGSVDANGSVECNNVEGNVEASGNVICNDISGDIDAMGSVSVKRRRDS